METWLTFAIKRPGPIVKTGYPGAEWRTLAEIEGEVKHSAEGSYSAAMGELDKLTRQASWHFTVCQDGNLYQHYPLESITWHAGLPGDRRQDTSLIGNLALVGVEHEGGGPNTPGEPLTEPQLQATLRLTREIRRLCPSVGAPALRKNLWEHNWLSQTSCPSGRIPWPKFLEEEDMTPEEVRAIVIDTILNADFAWGEGGKLSIMEKVKQVRDSLKAHADIPHGGAVPVLKVTWPGATVSIPPVTVDVEKA